MSGTAQPVADLRLWSSAVAGAHWLEKMLHSAAEPPLFGPRLWASVSLALCAAFWLQLDNPFWAGIADHLADEVEVPIGTICCGTAGDRGLLHPELVVSATREITSVLNARPAEAYLSANRTCEMGLQHATGRPYESFVFLLVELSRPVEGRGSA
jgi:hypothetical protein